MDMLAKITKDLKMNSRACLTGLLLTFTALPVLAGNISGSAHDFSAAGWNSSGEICVTCHTPHNSDTTVSDAPLWNHEVTVQTYAMYASPTFDATADPQPTGTTKLCLSCHDGSVALDSFGNANGGTFIQDVNANAAVGLDGLNNDHPISFVYDTALVALDGALHDPSTAVTIGAGADIKVGTIASTMLIAGKLECASCHDVHNKFTDGPYLLRVNNNGSGLCLTCHNK